MQDILINRAGSYMHAGTEFSGGNMTHLIYNDPSFEVTHDVFPKGTVGCFYTMDTEEFEFNYIIKGRLEIFDVKEKVLLSPGDTFCYQKLERNHLFKAIDDVELLSIRKTPCFGEFEESVTHLNEILFQLQNVDGDTLSHCERVKNLTMGIAYYLEFDQSQLLNLFYAAKFHDVGKARIPVEILLKPEKLTDEEYKVMKTHSRHTYEMILEYYGPEVAKIAFDHHERLDGKGYPQGLKGNEISLAARIICVADAYDAMVVTRPYRVGMTAENALGELRRCQDIQFDSIVIDALEKYLLDLDKEIN